MNLTTDQSNEVNRTQYGSPDKRTISFIRIALGITYIWFGVLKLTGKSPVADMVRKTSLFLPDNSAVQIVGTVETVIGIGLLTKIALKPALLLFFGQIASTFLFLILRPQESFQKGNLLLLTQRGEFIMKNLILLSAGIAVASAAGHEKAN